MFKSARSPRQYYDVDKNPAKFLYTYRSQLLPLPSVENRAEGATSESRMSSFDPSTLDLKSISEFRHRRGEPTSQPENRDKRLEAVHLLARPLESQGACNFLIGCIDRVRRGILVQDLQNLGGSIVVRKNFASGGRANLSRRATD